MAVWFRSCCSPRLGVLRLYTSSMGEPKKSPMPDRKALHKAHEQGRPDRTRHPLDLSRLGSRYNRPSNHVVEKAPAHAISDKTEASCRRGDLFEKRAALMDDVNHCLYTD